MRRFEAIRCLRSGSFRSSFVPKTTHFGTPFGALFPVFCLFFAKRIQLLFFLTCSSQDTSTLFSWVRLVKTPFFGKTHASRRQRCSSGLLACRVRSRLGRPVAALCCHVSHGKAQARTSHRPFSNNYRPYTTTATPRPAKISILDNRSFLIRSVAAGADRGPFPV